MLMVFGQVAGAPARGGQRAAGLGAKGLLHVHAQASGSLANAQLACSADHERTRLCCSFASSAARRQQQRQPAPTLATPTVYCYLTCTLLANQGAARLAAVAFFTSLPALQQPRAQQAAFQLFCVPRWARRL
jgi:hypothetical protein